jgi:hypothetical protein
MLVKYTPAFGNMSEIPRDEILPKEERRSRVALVIVFGFVVDSLGSDCSL